MSTSSPAPPPPSSSSPPTATPPPTAFVYPPHASFPPFYTLQPNLTTRASQLASWTALILAYAAHHRLFTLTPTHPLFTNPRLRKTLPPDDARTVLRHMAASGRIAWARTLPSAAAAGAADEAWVWWRTPEEWAGEVAGWVERTGQRGAVLTVWELRRGEATGREGWWGMPEEMLGVVLGVLERRGRAAVFGEVGERGVKFV